MKGNLLRSSTRPWDSELKLKKNYCVQKDTVCAILSMAIFLASYSLPLWLIPLLSVLMERVVRLHRQDAGEEMHACASS